MQFDLTRLWYQPRLHWLTALLLPFSFLFYVIVTVRKYLYQYHLLRVRQAKVPVIVVGNIVAGGTGKTPFVIWLAEQLRLNGYHPGIVSRGVGGKKHSTPHFVKENDAPACVGDEALLLVKRTQCPMVICTDRASAVEVLSNSSPCDVVISDDGLQHYRMARHIEIAVVDEVRQSGNGWLLPAGPLREPVKRLMDVDWVVTNRGADHQLSISMQPGLLRSVKSPDVILEVKALLDKPVHAVAGIGHPEQFFEVLKQNGYQVIPHCFPDHHLYSESDFSFDDNLPVIMTEKDAVKCRGFSGDNWWYVESAAVINQPDFIESVLQKLRTFHA